MASITFEHSQGPIPDPEQENLAWLQHPAIQDALQCLQWPMAQADSNHPKQVADFFGYKSQEILRTAEELKRQSAAGEPTLEEATELYFAGSMLAGLGNIIKNPKDIISLQSLIGQSECNDTAIGHESTEEEDDPVSQIAEAEPTQDETSLTDQIIQTMAIKDEGFEPYKIGARVKSASAFRNSWVMGVVDELMAAPETMSKSAAVDQLTELYCRIATELKLNREKIGNDSSPLPPNEVRMLTEVNIILEVADRVFRDFSSKINRTGDIKSSVIAVMKDEEEELKKQLLKVLEEPVYASKEETDWARHTLEILEAGTLEETSSGADSTERGGEEIQPLATVEDRVIQHGVPKSAHDITPLRLTSVENPSFVRSITSGVKPTPPAVATNAKGVLAHGAAETKVGGPDAAGAILKPEVQANLINIAIALGDKEAEEIVRRGCPSTEELKVLQAMTRRAHELKEREEPSRQSTRRPDTIGQAKRLGEYVISPSRRGYA